MATVDGEICDGPPKAYTIGYEGDTPESFWRRLSSARVETLVDVREVPRSRKLGFSKAALSTFLARRGVGYVHLEALGSPRGAREELRRTGDLGSFMRAYEGHLEDVSGEFERLVALARDGPTAMMCFERDPARCHRSVISRRLRVLGFEVVDL